MWSLRLQAGKGRCLSIYACCDDVERRASHEEVPLPHLHSSSSSLPLSSPSFHPSFLAASTNHTRIQPISLPPTHHKIHYFPPNSSSLLIDDETQPSLDTRVVPLVSLLVEDSSDGSGQDLVPGRDRSFDTRFVVREEGGDGGHPGEEEGGGGGSWAAKEEARKGGRRGDDFEIGCRTNSRI